jgi:flagellar biosynthesis/type III secretory pathway protein FliH
MAPSETGDLTEEIDARISELGLAKKQLKKPSTISFAERRDMTAKAEAALAELQARRAALAEAAPEGDAEGGSEGSSEGQTQLLADARAALEAAETILSRVAAAQPAGASRGAGSGGRKLPGENQRGPGGNSASTAGRTSRRIGTD